MFSAFIPQIASADSGLIEGTYINITGPVRVNNTTAYPVRIGDKVTFTFDAGIFATATHFVSCGQTPQDAIFLMQSTAAGSSPFEFGRLAAAVPCLWSGGTEVKGVSFVMDTSSHSLTAGAYKVWACVSAATGVCDKSVNLNLYTPRTVSGRLAKADGTAIAGASVGVSPTLPSNVTSALTDASGNYSFTNVPNGIAYTLTPSAGYTFAPGSRSVTVTTGNITGQDFTGSGIASCADITGSSFILFENTNCNATIAGAQLSVPANTYWHYLPDQNFNDLADSIYVPANAGVSMMVYYDQNRGVASSCLRGGTGNLANLQGVAYASDSGKSLHKSISSLQTFSNGTCTPPLIQGQIADSVTGSAVPAGVPVTLTKPDNTTVELAGGTNAGGYYIFSDLADGTYTITPHQTGYVFSPASKTKTIAGASIYDYPSFQRSSATPAPTLQCTTITINTVTQNCVDSRTLPLRLYSVAIGSSVSVNYSIAAPPAGGHVTFSAATRYSTVTLGTVSTTATTPFVASTTWAVPTIYDDTATIYASAYDQAGVLLAVSPSVELRIGASVPAAPTNLASPSQTSTSNNLTWSFTGSATGFHVYRKPQADTGYPSAPTATVTSATTLSYNDTGLTAGVPYCYLVTAYNGSGESNASNQVCPTVTLIPNPPSNLGATAVNSTKIHLVWTDNSSSPNETGFVIFDGTNHYYAGQNATSYDVTGLTPGTYYNFEVASYITPNGGYSAFSNWAHATTPATVTTHAISGRIVDAAGTAFAGVAVTPNQAINGVSSVLTDANGAYRFAGASENTIYQLTASKTNTSFATATQNVQVGTADATLNFQVVYAVSGKVIGTNNVGLAGVTIATQYLTNPSISIPSGSTDSSGNFSFILTRSGDYLLTPSKTGYTFSQASQSVTIVATNVSVTNFVGTLAAVTPTPTITPTVTPTATPPAGSLAAPVLNTAVGSATTANLGSVALTWTYNGTGQSSFRIYRKLWNDAAYPASYITNSPVATDRTYTNASLTAGKTYCYQVVAVGGTLTSAPSNSVCASILAAPILTAATPSPATNSINLAWTLPVTSYDPSLTSVTIRVFRSLQAGVYPGLPATGNITSLSGTSTSYADPNRTFGTQYFYELVAFDNHQAASFHSVERSATVVDIPPTLGLTVSSAGGATPFRFDQSTLLTLTFALTNPSAGNLRMTVWYNKVGETTKHYIVGSTSQVVTAPSFAKDWTPPYAGTVCTGTTCTTVGAGTGLVPGDYELWGEVVDGKGGTGQTRSKFTVQ
ncbi:MAG: carboxypeptidase regulatory-like domain-containing protein [bacterium]